MKNKIKAFIIRHDIALTIVINIILVLIVAYNLIMIAQGK